MCFFSPPKPPAPPPLPPLPPPAPAKTPEATASDVARTRKQQRQQLAVARGRGGTIKTGGQGLSDSPDGLKTVLGT